MAYSTITMKNPHTHQIKICPVGFSWTVFFFGFFPPLFRSDFKWFLIIIFCTFFTLGLSNWVFGFIYNKMSLKDIVSKGFKAQSVQFGSVEQVSAKVGFHIGKLES